MSPVPTIFDPTISKPIRAMLFAVAQVNMNLAELFELRSILGDEIKFRTSRLRLVPIPPAYTLSQLTEQALKAWRT